MSEQGTTEARIAALETRVATLEAQNAITELATAYAVACDQHDMPALIDLFTEDATFTSPSGLMVAEGRTAIEQMFVELFKVRGPAFHWTHDVCVEVSAPDRAKGVVYSHAETTPNGRVSIAAMRYLDSYRATEGRWQFAAREIQFLYYVPFERYHQGLNREARLTVGEETRPADYPETLEAWQHFHRAHGRTWS